MPKKFKFRLEAMLKYRGIIEEERKREFAYANAAVTEKHRQAEELSAERAETMNNLRSLTESGEINVRSLSDTLRYVGNLDLSLATVQREEEQLRRAMEGVRQAFIAANRDKRVVESLKEKQLENYRYETNREEQKEMEEIALRVVGKKEARPSAEEIA